MQNSEYTLNIRGLEYTLMFSDFTYNGGSCRLKIYMKFTKPPPSPPPPLPAEAVECVFHEAQFTVPDWGIKSTMAQGCRLYPPVSGYDFGQWCFFLNFSHFCSSGKSSFTIRHKHKGTR